MWFTKEMLFRYPGGKNKLVDTIIQNIPCRGWLHEPFFGGGAVTLQGLRLELFNKVWINDKDEAIAELWTRVIRNPGSLKRAVRLFQPSVDKFNRFSEDLLHGDTDPLKKLAVHQMSYSGLGPLAGPIGGQSQNSRYKVGCRWNKVTLCKRIGESHDLLSGGRTYQNRCTRFDFEELLEDSPTVATYLDPPYYQKGDKLYTEKFSKKDHERLAKCLRHLDGWVLSYDDCPEVRKLYRWANVRDDVAKLNYSISHGANKGSELFIVPRHRSFIARAA